MCTVLTLILFLSSDLFSLLFKSLCDFVTFKWNGDVMLTLYKSGKNTTIENEGGTEIEFSETRDDDDRKLRQSLLVPQPSMKKLVKLVANQARDNHEMEALSQMNQIKLGS